MNLTLELGCQWPRKGVRVNAIAPGYFPTEGTAGPRELVADQPPLKLGEDS